MLLCRQICRFSQRRAAHAAAFGLKSARLLPRFARHFRRGGHFAAAAKRLAALVLSAMLILSAGAAELASSMEESALQEAAAREMDALRRLAGPDAVAGATKRSLGSKLRQSDPRPVVRIAVINNFGPGQRRDFIDATLDALRRAIPDRRIDVTEVPLLAAQADPMPLLEDYQFVSAPAEFFAISAPPEAFSRIATKAAIPASLGRAQVDSSGTAVVVRADRRDLTDLADLQGASIAATMPNSLSGWLALEGEIHDAGFDERNFFGDKVFMQYGLPDALVAVLEGTVDAAALPACALEDAERTGLIEPGSLRVIHAKPRNALGCARSTPLYPESAFAATRSASEELIRSAASALLSMPPQFSAQWLIGGSHADVMALAEKLRLGPYAEKHSFADFFAENKWLFIGALLFVMLLLSNELRLRRQLRRKSAALSKALFEKEAAEEETRRAREQLSALENRGMVSHLSSMVAHELKQPLAAIAAQCATLKMRMNDALNDDDESADAMLGIEESARRISGIVDRVRGYAREQRAPEKRCDLRTIVAHAIDAFLHESTAGMPIDYACRLDEAPVWGVELELELLVLNLLRNASAAAAKLAAASIVDASLSAAPDGSRAALLRIVNASEPISDEVLKRMNDGVPGFASASGGLGIGLSIVHLIADRHAISLRFSRVAPDGGIAAEALIPLLPATGEAVSEDSKSNFQIADAGATPEGSFP